MTESVPRRVTLLDPARARPGLVGVVAEPTPADLDYAREIYTPHGLGPAHGQVLVRWQPDQPEKGTWHWPDELRELPARVNTGRGTLQTSRDTAGGVQHRP